MLEVVSRMEEGQFYCEIRGILDYATVDTFRVQAANLAGIRGVVLDCSGLEFSDSSGIGAIIDVIYVANERNANVEIIGMNERIKEIFEAVGVLQILRDLRKGD
jgi:anti-anti-sigma factor